MNLTGLHHITAIATDPRRNMHLYTRVLGLRFVKKTVNFDDPTTYHLYYGDSVATPGSILTFFPWADVPPGRPGVGQAYATAYSVAADTLPFWQARLAAHGVTTAPLETRFNESVLGFTDPDGLILELVATDEPDARVAWTHPEIPQAHGLRGFHSVTLAVPAKGTASCDLLTGPMNHRVIAAAGHRTRLSPAPAAPGTYVDLLDDPALPTGRQGAGTVHHVAFRVTDDTDHAAAHAEARALGLNVSPIIDRNYFHSIDYREPAGVLFEIATDPPGFTVDESLESLGQTLRIPPQYEPHRTEIEAALPKLD